MSNAECETCCKSCRKRPVYKGLKCAVCSGSWSRGEYARKTVNQVDFKCPNCTTTGDKRVTRINIKHAK